MTASKWKATAEGICIMYILAKKKKAHQKRIRHEVKSKKGMETRRSNKQSVRKSNKQRKNDQQLSHTYCK